MKPTLTLAQKAIVLVSVPLMFEILFVGTLGILLSQAEYERAQESHAKDIAYKCNDIFFMVIQLGSRAVISEYFKRTTGKPVVDPPEKMSARALADFQSLKDLAEGHPEEEAAISRVEELHQEVRTRMKKFRKDTDSDPMAAARQLFEVREKISLLQTAISEITARQNKIQLQRSHAQAQARKWITLDLLIGMVFNIFLALSMAFYFNRGTGRRLEVLMDNTRRLAKGQELHPPIEGNDEIAHLDAVFNEMAAALAEAARKERAVIAHAMDVICSLDAEGKFISVNPASQKVWGYSPEELAGKSWKEIVCQEDHERTESSFERVRSGDSTVPIENRVRRQGGNDVDVLWSAHWSEAENSFFCVAHDITERKEIERMKREFVAMVSHDLRTPLTSVQGFLSLLQTGMYGELNDSGEQNLSYADTSVSRLINLINDLLDIEKMESGKFELNCANVSADEVMDSAVQSTRGYAEQQGVTLELAESQLSLSCDGDRLIQVLVNLISNAVKFSPQGSKVIVSAAPGDNYVEFRVTDHGRGIPEDLRAAVFERFRQVDKSDAKKLRGSGLGLAICKAIVERHGGIIDVNSKEGEGSTFWFRVPIAPGVSLSEENPHILKTGSGETIEIAEKTYNQY